MATDRKKSVQEQRKTPRSGKSQYGRRTTDGKDGQFGQCPYCASPALTRKIYKERMQVRFTCASCGRWTTKPHKIELVSMRSVLPKRKRYIITAAQNATPIHEHFWLALKKAAEYYSAEIVVIPGRYKNPTSLWTQKNQENEWWDPAVTPHLYCNSDMLGARLMILGDLKIEWASGSPLNGLDALTKDASGIVGHSQRALRSIPAPTHKHPKIMFTTGACTIPNYTDTRRGRIAEFNHTLGALIVELDAKDVYFVRQLNAAQDGSFIDLDKEFVVSWNKTKRIHEAVVRRAKPALSLTLGDIHQRFVSPSVVQATFGAPDCMVKLLRPEHLVWHDVLDQYARNHHHKGNWTTAYGKWKHGIGDVRKEIEDAVQFVIDMTPKGTTSVVVSGNHDRAVERWLREADFREDPENMEFFLRAALHRVQTVRMTSGGMSADDPFIAHAQSISGPEVRFLQQGESFVLAGVEHGLHGDQGPNGGRGTTRNLSTLGVKVTKGHSHTAEIINGCYSAGKSTDMLEYEEHGPSSHSKAHVVLYANGKRAVLFIVNGKYCIARPKK